MSLEIINPLYCKLCKLRDGCNQPLQPTGNGSILVVIDNPTLTEDQTGYHFTDLTGDYLDKILKQAELSRRDICLTNAVKCRGKYTKKQGEFCADVWLKNEISRHKVVICLGAKAASLALEVPVSKIKMGSTKVGETIFFITYSISFLLNKGKKFTDSTVEVFKSAKSL